MRAKIPHLEKLTSTLLKCMFPKDMPENQLHPSNILQHSAAAI
jgi:hypothetical protein